MPSLHLVFDRAVEAWLHGCDPVENSRLLHSKAHRRYKPQPAGRMDVHLEVPDVIQLTSSMMAADNMSRDPNSTMVQLRALASPAWIRAASLLPADAFVEKALSATVKRPTHRTRSGMIASSPSGRSTAIEMLTDRSMASRATPGSWVSWRALRSSRYSRSSVTACRAGRHRFLIRHRRQLSCEADAQDRQPNEPHVQPLTPARRPSEPLLSPMILRWPVRSSGFPPTTTKAKERFALRCEIS
jgi:hypothetical protein